MQLIMLCNFEGLNLFPSNGDIRLNYLPSNGLFPATKLKIFFH